MNQMVIIQTMLDDLSFSDSNNDESDPIYTVDG